MSVVGHGKERTGDGVGFQSKGVTTDTKFVLNKYLLTEVQVFMNWLFIDFSPPIKKLHQYCVKPM